MFISHCHVGLIGFGAEPGDKEVGTIRKLDVILQAAGVDGAVVFAPFGNRSTGWAGPVAERFGDPNDWLSDEIKKWPNLVGFACINPKDADAPSRLERAVSAGLVGAKLHPPVQGFTINDRTIYPFYAAAEKLRAPIHIHTGVHGGHLKTYEPLLLDDVLQEHPDLIVIMDHLGGYAFFDQALAVLHNNGNCYAGITAMRLPQYQLPPDRIKILLETVGVERIIYGMDYPWKNDNLAGLKGDIEWIESWPLSQQEKELLLGGNLKKLLHR